MYEREVELSQDHIERQARCSAGKALEELIWNALDAGGPSVQVRLEVNELDAVEAIEIEDRGAGIAFDDLDRAFGTIGMSLKLERKKTAEGRVFHGSEGRGRFRALVLGDRATWSTVYEDDGKRQHCIVTITRSQQRKFTVTEPKETKRPTGTVLRVENIDKGEQALQNERPLGYLTERLALYMKSYPDVAVTYDGHGINPLELIENSATYLLTPLTEGADPPSLDVIEWKFKPEGKKIFICDPDGFVWHEMGAGVRARDINYSAYVRCAEATEWHEAGMFFTADLNQEISKLVEQAQQKLREHVRKRLTEEAQEVVEEWKEAKIYPYSADEPETPIQNAERQVFDIVASRVHLYHQPFRDADIRTKKFTLHLVRQALESNPTSLRRILQEVLRLPREQQDELAGLFDRMDLRSIIAAAKEVELRLKAIVGFDEILFSDEWKKHLLERTQLHRLLVRHLWIFGEEFTLDTDDEPLRKVLAKHLHHLGREKLAPKVDVKLINGKDGIPDLMLSRKFKRDRSKVEHLVIELKRPANPLGDAEINQIKHYAYAVGADERFSKDETKWTFVLVGNNFDAFAESEAESEGSPYGRLTKKGNLEIWIRRWSDVLHEAKSRYDFFQERLEYEASSDEGLQYLHTHYTELMQGRGLTKKQEKEREAATTA